MPAAERETASMASAFRWMLAGNIVSSASQWLVLSLIAKLGSQEMLGRWAWASSVATPLAMLSHMNLRTVLVTDVRRAYTFGDFRRVRLTTSAAGLLLITAVGLTMADHPETAALIALTALSYAFEEVSDLYYGALQRRDRLDLVGRSVMARGVLSLLVFAGVLHATESLIAAAAGLAAVRAAILLAWDMPRGRIGEDHSPGSHRHRLSIWRSALPLGAVLFLLSLRTNIPRYSVEHHLGVAELGIFAAAASFITGGSMIVGAAGQSVASRLARLHDSGDLARWRRLGLRFAAAALLTGLAGALLSGVAGDHLLTFFYRREFASWAPLLTACLGSASLIYLGSALGYVNSSARTFGPQLPLLAVSAIVAFAVSEWLVPRIGLFGAAASLALSALVHVAGSLWLFARAMQARGT